MNFCKKLHIYIYRIKILILLVFIFEWGTVGYMFFMHFIF